MVGNNRRNFPRACEPPSKKELVPPERFDEATGVGSNDPDSLSDVRGTKSGSRNNVPFDIKPERGQLPENVSSQSSPVSSKQVCAVFQEQDTGSKFASESNDLRKKSCALSSDAGALSSRGDVLAREATRDDIDILQLIGADFAHVLKDRHAWPSLG